MIIMMQLAASKLSIWGSCEKSRESHTPKKTRVRGALVLSLAACFTCHNWRAYSKAIIQFIIHSVVYYLFLADLIPPLAGDADGDPAPPCKNDIKSYIFRAFSLTWPTAIQIYCNKKVCTPKKRQLPQHWFRTPSWAPLHCFGTPILPKQVDRQFRDKRDN